MTQPPPSAPARRPDASMSLLIEAARSPLDPGYAQAAARRAAEPGAPRSRVATAVVGVVAVLLGLGTVWAGRELRAPGPDVLQARALLEARIEERNAEAQALLDGNTELAAEVAALSAEALAGIDDELVATLQSQGAAVGTVAVTGPGVAITLTDSARAQAGAQDAADERVQDLDLQIVANGLWAAGAEAIAVNGQRLTAVSAIRSAGEAILVDLVPLVGPYRVEAVGDSNRLQSELARSAAASHLALLRETYSIGVQIQPVASLALPASPVPTLRHATPWTEESVAGDEDDVPGSAQSPGESP